MSQPVRIAFFGTPAFAETLLASLAVNSPSPAEVVLVVSQPDQPVGRSGTLTAPPVAAFARAHGLPLVQPERIRGDAAFLTTLRDTAPDLLLVAAYGKILPPEILDTPRLFPVNVHASILPAYRGASPISQAILNGAPETGVTLMRMDAGLDTGPILDRPYAVQRVPIAADATTDTLTQTLSRIGVRQVSELLSDLSSGAHPACIEQDAPTTPLTRPLEKADGLLRFAEHSATALERRVRAMDPWPVAHTTWNGQLLRIWRASVVAETPDAPPGTVVPHAAGAAITTADGLLAPTELQLAGKKRLPIEEFLRGARGFVGSTLGA